MFTIFGALICAAVTIDVSKYVEQGKNWLAIQLIIPKNHYVYGAKPQEDTTPLKVEIEGVSPAHMQWECPVRDHEMNLDVYKDNVVILAPYDKKSGHIKVSYGMCTDTVCRPPATVEKSFQYAQLPKVDPVTYSRYKALCVKAEAWSIWPFIFAFLGGLLLNIMPCILPVLSLKMVSFLQDTTSRLHHSLLYAAGNIATFVGLGLMTGMLKFLGNAGGWGFHLQNPLFIFALMCLFVVMIMSIFDLIALPMLQRTTPKSSFWSGVMTVIVGAPCCMPLMSTAISYGLTQSLLESIFIFAFLGLGMATPFLLLSIVPVRFLPQPGDWLKWVKPTLGFILIITVIWLLQIYAALTNLDHFLIIGSMLVGMAYALWLWGHALIRGWLTLVIICGLVGGGMVYSLNKPMAMIAYSETALEQNINQGKNVLIYATAKWCISCKINGLVLQRASIQQLLKDHNTVLMLADYTNQDEAITLLLRKHNIAGVPATLLVKGGTTQVLPEVLTESALTAALT